MMKNKLYINVEVEGIEKNLLVVTEKPSGDVYIRIQSGVRLNSIRNEHIISEDRISLHPSLNSSASSTIKHTVSIKEDSQKKLLEIVCLTDAVKRKSGFTQILTHRCTDLRADHYAKGAKKPSRVVGSFDPRTHCLIFSIFVGHPETPFEPAPAEVSIEKITTLHFQIVICMVLVNFCAIPFGFTASSLTTAQTGPIAGNDLQSYMQLFQLNVYNLTTNLLSTASNIMRSSGSEEHEFFERLLERHLEMPPLPFYKI